MGIFDAGANLIGTLATNYQNKQMWETTMQREDNAMQRKVKDLEAAGLNPILAAGGPGAPTSAAPQMKAPDMAGIDEGILSLQTRKDVLRTVKAKADQDEADAASRTRLNNAQANLLELQGRGQEQQYAHNEILYPALRDKLSSEIARIQQTIDQEGELFFDRKRMQGYDADRMQTDLKYQADYWEKKLREMDSADLKNNAQKRVATADAILKELENSALSKKGPDGRTLMERGKETELLLDAARLVVMQAAGGVQKLDTAFFEKLGLGPGSIRVLESIIEITLKAAGRR